MRFLGEQKELPVFHAGDTVTVRYKIGRRCQRENSELQRYCNSDQRYRYNKNIHRSQNVR